MKTSFRKIFPISSIDGKYSVSIIETIVVKIKVTIKCDMKTMADNFCVAENLLEKLTNACKCTNLDTIYQVQQLIQCKL